MSGFLAFFKTLWEIIQGIKAIFEGIRTFKENQRREDFKEGVAEKDTTKIEESFDSDQAGVPDKIGDIEWDDEKPSK